MFAGLINQTKVAVSGLVLKYVARASVAIPFVIALGFAVAAIAAMLVPHFGHVAGYWIIAGGLAGVGIVAAIVVGVKQNEEKVAEQNAEQADTQKGCERRHRSGDHASSSRTSRRAVCVTRRRDHCP